MMHVAIQGRPVIDKGLDGFSAKARKVLDAAVQQSGAILRDATKKLPPVSAKTTGYGAKGIPVDTGLLRQRIQKQKMQALAVRVFPAVQYGEHVHQGTANMPARPYFDWALEAGAEAEIDRVMQQVLSQLP